MSGEENIEESDHSKDEEDDTCIEITPAADTMQNAKTYTPCINIISSQVQQRVNKITVNQLLK